MQEKRKARKLSFYNTLSEDARSQHQSGDSQRKARNLALREALFEKDNTNDGIEEKNGAGDQGEKDGSGKSGNKEEIDDIEPGGGESAENDGDQNKALGTDGNILFFQPLGLEKKADCGDNAGKKEGPKNKWGGFVRIG